MLVRVDHNGIGVVHIEEFSSSWLVEFTQDQAEISAVGRIHMNPKTVFGPKRHNVAHGICSTDRGSAQRDHHGAHVSFAQFVFQRIKSHPAPTVRRDARKLEL